MAYSHEYKVGKQLISVKRLTTEQLASLATSGTIDPVALLYMSTGHRASDLAVLTDEEFWTLADSAMLVNHIPRQTRGSQ